MAAAVVAAAHRVRRLWRSSISLRVVMTTVVLSMVIVSVLGALLLRQVTDGVLEAKQRASVAEAAAGLADAQRILVAADTGPTTPSAAVLVDTAFAAATRAGQQGLYEVLLLASRPQVRGNAPERGTNLVSETSVPVELRDTVAVGTRQAWTYSEIVYLDGRGAPGLVVGAPITVPGVGGYELYYLFPLTQEQSTLDLVRSAVLGTGALLVLGVALLAWFVTRQVVTPVRTAARTAERFKAGKLTERMAVKGEDDLAALATSFNQMAASLQDQIHRLEDLSRVQQRFVSDVSHELRTPLTTVRMAADVLFEGRDRFDAPTARAAELLQNQLDRFEALLADLLEISRYDAGVAVLDAERADMRSLAAHAVDAALPLARVRGSLVELDLPETPCLLDCDSRRIDRIVRNLVVNAIEHGEGRPVRVSVAADDDAVALTVRDLGVGLRPGDAAMVFNRFWRADPARARTLGGTGLGLSIALEDARLHGGWLQAWGEPGMGSQFRLTLPRVAGGVVLESPLPLEPPDAGDGRRMPVAAPFLGTSRVGSDDD